MLRRNTLEVLEKSVAITTIPILELAGKGPRTEEAIRVRGALHVAASSRRDTIVLLDTRVEVNTVD